jgi:predicted regulator of Ras-like GTPase activity (Roadblock/LC7/MglB family)
VEPAAPAPDGARLIAELTDRVRDVRHALVVSADGIPAAASDGIPPDQLERLAAITSGLLSLACGAARAADAGAVTQALVVMAECTLVIMAIDDGSSLAVLAAATADLDQVAYEMTTRIDELTIPAGSGE